MTKENEKKPTNFVSTREQGSLSGSGTKVVPSEDAPSPPSSGVLISSPCPIGLLQIPNKPEKGDTTQAEADDPGGKKPASDTPKETDSDATYYSIPPPMYSPSPQVQSVPGAYFVPRSMVGAEIVVNDVEPAVSGVTAEPLITLSARPVDENLERAREQRLSQQERELQEKAGQIQEMRQLQERRRRCMLIALFVVLGIAVISIAVSLTVGRGGGDKLPPVVIPPTVTPAPTPLQPWELLGDSINGEAPYDNFGMSVDLSKGGNIVAVGAIGNDGDTGNLGDNRGHVRVFGYNSNSSQWVQIGEDLDGKHAYDQLGKTVSVSNSQNGVIVAAGAPTLPDTDEPSTVRVFRYDIEEQHWMQLGYTFTGDTWYDDFGYEVASSDNGIVLAVTCPGCGIGSAVGQVQVFEYRGDWDMWLQLGQNITGQGNYSWFGSSVALNANGTVVASGAIWDSFNGAEAGSVRVFRYDAVVDNWTQSGQPLYGNRNSDWFGYSVALSSDGDILAVGACGANSMDRTGYIKVYRYWHARNEWYQIGQPLHGEAAGDNFGTSVDLSDDGLTIIGGGHLHDSGVRNNTGQARIYQYDRKTDLWNQIGLDINGIDEDDGAGRAVAISGSGKLVAVASPWHDQNGNHSGQVRVFKQADLSG